MIEYQSLVWFLSVARLYLLFLSHQVHPCVHPSSTITTVRRLLLHPVRTGAHSWHSTKGHLSFTCSIWRQEHHILHPLTGGSERSLENSHSPRTWKVHETGHKLITHSRDDTETPLHHHRVLISGFKCANASSKFWDFLWIVLITEIQVTSPPYLNFNVLKLLWNFFKSPPVSFRTKVALLIFCCRFSLYSWCTMM